MGQGGRIVSTQELERLKGSVDLAEVVSRYTQVRGRASQELKGPCPMCGGRDRFSVFKDRQGWMCRGCTPESGDVFTFIQKVENCDFKRAIEILGGNVLPSKRRPVVAAPPVKKAPTYTEPEWQTTARATLEADVNALKTNQPALEYLAKRGITKASQIVWQLGYNAKKRAITLPWLSASKEITAIKFRYVNAWTSKDGKLQRFCQLEGGNQIVFGGQFVHDNKPTILVEGEFNAISIRQTCPHVHVLCAGGDTNYQPMVMLLNLFPESAVWMDDPERIHRVQEEWGHPIRAKFASPNGMDANDILVKHGSAALAEIVLRLTSV